VAFVATGRQSRRRDIRRVDRPVDLPGGDFDTLMASIADQLLTLPDDTVVIPATARPRPSERSG